MSEPTGSCNADVHHCSLVEYILSKLCLVSVFDSVHCVQNLNITRNKLVSK